MRFLTLNGWLAWLETLHPSEIDLGLERLGCAAKQAQLDQIDATIISIAGTNGKGSCVAMLEAIYLEAGYTVGAYTSPHLLEYNERIRVNGVSASDTEICEAFDHIDSNRGNISLTYFEFATLAAVDIFIKQNCDIVLLEVGLGGRLDAVNLYDADIALISSIGIDHTQWLGNNRNSIGREKAGIARQNKILLCGDQAPPDSIAQVVAEKGARLKTIGSDFNYQIQTDGSWHWSSDSSQLILPKPVLTGEHQYRNTATVLQAVHELQTSRPVTVENISNGLAQVKLPARIELIKGPINLLFDVAHNAAASQQLADFLRDYKNRNDSNKHKIYAVFSVLADKNINKLLAPLASIIDYWLLAPINSPRSVSQKDLFDQVCQALNAAKQSQNDQHRLVKDFESIELAWAYAQQSAEVGDTIVVFGSFITVAEVFKLVRTV